MNNYRDPGYRFFEPSDKFECADCHEIVDDDLACESMDGKVVCFDCMLDWGGE